MTSNTHCLKRILLVTLAVVIAGCSNRDGSHTGSAPATRPLDILTPAQEAQRQQGIAARDRLFESLLGELVQSLSKNGPARSITVCKELAPEIARKVSQETGVKIGRTSFKTRNPGNRPPGWAASFVQDHVDQEINVELPDRGLGILLPIHLQSTCTLCHGSDQEITRDVKAAIVSHYPDDQATGFSVGDLRGYFWIEVPERRNSD